MHKTGACLPKLGQVDPLVQALVLDPSNAMNKNMYAMIMKDLIIIMLSERKLS
jgi:hypothetical protein